MSNPTDMRTYGAYPWNKTWSVPDPFGASDIVVTVASFPTTSEISATLQAISAQPSTGSITIAETIPTTLQAVSSQPTTGSLSASVVIASSLQAITANPTTGSISVEVRNDAQLQSITAQPSTGSVSIGLVISASLQAITASPTTGSISVSVPASLQSISSQPSTGSITISEQLPEVTLPSIVAQPETGSLQVGLVIPASLDGISSESTTGTTIATLVLSVQTVGIYCLSYVGSISIVTEIPDPDMGVKTATLDPKSNSQAIEAEPVKLATLDSFDVLATLATYSASQAFAVQAVLTIALEQSPENTTALETYSKSQVLEAQ